MLCQQLASPQFTRPEEVVSHMGALQAQEYRLMRWAVSMRTRRPSASAFQKAYDSGRIIRLHLLRGTWQLVSGEDYRWMLALCMPKARKVIEGWMSANSIHIPDEEYTRIRDLLVRCAADKGSVTKEDFAAALAARDIRMDDHRLSYHIRMAELSGTLCSGNLHPSKATYALTDTKVPAPSPLERDEALALLARKYFRSHSPATLEDYVWWSGLSVSNCRRGIATLGNELHPVRWKESDYYLHEEARCRGFRRGSTILLPSYDEYLIGYKSRGLVLPEGHRHRAHNNSGIFYPVILCDGHVCGNWKPFARQLSVELFEGTTPPPSLAAAWQAYQAFQTR